MKRFNATSTRANVESPGCYCRWQNCRLAQPGLTCLRLRVGYAAKSNYKAWLLNYAQAMVIVSEVNEDPLDHLLDQKWLLIGYRNTADEGACGDCHAG